MTTTSENPQGYTTTSTSPPPNPPSFRGPTQNYIHAQSQTKTKTTSTTTTTDSNTQMSAEIPADGRKKSISASGEEEATSPILQSWKPSLDRRQSWNKEDLKREFTERMLERRQSLGLDEGGRGKGFSEGVGNRVV